MKPLQLIVAMSQSGAIGQGGKLPWHAPEDLKRFRRLTTGHAVIMGRKTYESIKRPALPERTNIVLSSALTFGDPEAGLSRMSGPPTRLFAARDLADALAIAYLYDPAPFIIGGASVYTEALPLVTRIHRTVIAGEYPDADVFMPRGWADGFDLVEASTGEAPVLQYQTLGRSKR